MNYKITAAKIAEKANVSPATVSRYLNQRELVKNTTIEKIEAAMKELGCGFSSQSFEEKEQPIVVMTIPELRNSFFKEIIQGAKTAANAHGCCLLLYESQLKRSAIDDFCRLLKQVRAAGTIILTRLSAESLERIGAITPLVQCCEYNEEAGFTYVSINDIQAAESATKYLIEKGRNKIAFINGSASFNYAEKRQEGFFNAIDNAQITIPKQWVVRLPQINYEMAYAAICRIINGDIRPNAIFTVADDLAAAAIRAAKRYNLRVPEDIMVVGFDNIDLSIMTTPSITTVNQPKVELGYTAFEMLMELIENPMEEVKSILLDTNLVIREST